MGSSLCYGPGVQGSAGTRRLIWIAAVMGSTAVAAGAIGAHVLGDQDPVAAHRFKTAVEYHQIHALAFLGLGAAGLAGLRRWWPTAALWLVGSVLFCGSLYGLALGGPGVLAKIAPSGGMSMILGWLALFAAKPGPS